MQSINPAINELHEAYCLAADIEVPLSGPDERRWRDAILFGVTAEQVRLVVAARKRGIASGERRPASIYLRNLIADEDTLAEFAMELAAIKANMRKRVFVPGKAEVLRATGRSGEPEPDRPRHISELLRQKEAS